MYLEVAPVLSIAPMVSVWAAFHINCAARALLYRSDSPRAAPNYVKEDSNHEDHEAVPFIMSTHDEWAVPTWVYGVRDLCLGVGAAVLLLRAFLHCTRTTGHMILEKPAGS